MNDELSDFEWKKSEHISTNTKLVCKDRSAAQHIFFQALNKTRPQY